LAIDLNSYFLPSPDCSPLSFLADNNPVLKFCKNNHVQDDASSESILLPLCPFFFPNKDRHPNLHRSVPPLLPLQKNPTASCWERSHKRETRKYLPYLRHFFFKFSSKFHFCIGSLLFLFAEKHCRTVLGKVTQERDRGKFLPLSSSSFF